MQTGGRVNLQKAAEVLMYEFRQAVLGRITLETPEEFARWSVEAVTKEAQREAERKARKLARSGKKPKVTTAQETDSQ